MNWLIDIRTVEDSKELLSRGSTLRMQQRHTGRYNWVETNPLSYLRLSLLLTQSRAQGGINPYGASEVHTEYSHLLVTQ